jgi:hypothetical protein
MTERGVAFIEGCTPNQIAVQHPADHYPSAKLSLILSKHRVSSGPTFVATCFERQCILHMAKQSKNQLYL